MVKVIRFFDVLEDLFLLVLFLFLFLVGGYALVDTCLVYGHASDSSILRYKPGSGEDPPDREISGRITAWLTIDGTSIDYPVMQGSTNEEYLNKDPYGDYSLSGSIFLDSRNSSDFSDDYSLIYGHHMEGNRMFGPLTSYLKKDFFHTHKTAVLTVDGKALQVTFFAAIAAPATDPVIFSPSETSAGELIACIRNKEGILDEDGLRLQEGRRIVGLSTCRYPASLSRVIIFGYL